MNITKRKNFKKGDFIMAVNMRYGFAFFPIFQIVENKPHVYIVRTYQVDNEYDREGEEFLLPKDLDFMYMKVNNEKF